MTGWQPHQYDPYPQQPAPPYGGQGQMEPYAYPPRPKSTVVGLMLGLLLPGVGCMYAGRTGIGFLLLVLWLISIPLVFVSEIGFVTGLIAWISSAVLGYRMTREWNAANGIVS